jgi:hypothetical protein
MLSLEHPEIMNFLAGAGPGLWPMRSGKLGFTIAVKGSSDLAFAAKHKEFLKFHFYHLDVGGESAVGVITAIYDQSDAPIVIQTVCMDSVMRDSMLEMAHSDTLGIYFFDFHNSELFGGRWRLTHSAEAIQLLHTSLPDIEPAKRLEFYVAHKQKFSDPDNDGFVIEATLVEGTRPENLSIIHVTEENVLSLRGEGLGIYQSQLGISENPGKFQEAQIARLLARIYPAENVIVNAEISKGREFCDVLALGNHEAIAIQAKSTIQDERRFDEGADKRSARLNKHFQKALSQAQGADRAFYQLRKDISFENTKLKITPETKLLIHVIVLYDKLPTLLEEWSAEVSKFASDTTPVVVLDMPELTNMLSIYKTRESFLSALMAIVDNFENQKRIGDYEFGKDRIACF